MQMGVHDLVLVVALLVLALIVRFPKQYRSGMARLCSVEEEHIPAYPRQAAIALSIFFGFVLAMDFLRYLGWR
jgi:hypothetical protein